MKYLIQLALLLIPVFQLRAQQSNNQNYVISRTYKQAGENVNDVGKVKTDIEYVDGFGRTLQQVSVGQGLDGRDIVQPFQYDNQGRQAKNFLPYAVTGNGQYQQAGIANQDNFYSTNDVSLGLDPSDLGRPYSETQYEPSPLNRPLIVRAPGNKSANSTIAYKVNSASDVKRYDFNGTTVVENNNYPAGGLSYTETKDEEQKVIREYLDMKGNLICRKVDASESETLATYYVYDDRNLLRAVLQPKYQDDPSLANFAFTYTYDSRGRMIRKSIPGGGSISYVYDKYDRLALSQDENQLGNGVWAFNKYDEQNRRVMTGEFKSTNSQTAWQTLFDASTAHHESPTTTGIGYQFPNATEPTGVMEADVRTVTYYDSYSFPRPANLAFRTTPSAFYSVNNANVKSQVTGGRTRMLPGDNSTGGWLTNVIYYDNEYRPIQSIRELFDLGTGSIECVSTEYKYDLAPVVSQTRTEHIFAGAIKYTHLVTNSYDHADRLLNVKEMISAAGVTSKEAYTVAYRYNVLGQIQSKWLHSEDNLKYRRRTDFTNNIRGWVTKGATSYMETENSPIASFYSFGLEYLNSGNYSNGNVSAMRWSQKDDTGFTAGMGFLYDGANRLSGSTSLLSYKNLESEIKYDKNGNLTQLKRSGSAKDDLVYDYTGSGNKLNSIEDRSGDDSGVKKGTFSFTYDKNGSLTEDRQRGASITYNYLNLPKKVTIGGKDFVYDYDASGKKHKYTAPGIATYKYAGEAEYKAITNGNSLYRVGLNEGQAIVSGTTIRYDYYLKDHLGNIRIVFSENGEVLQNSDYYPFGLNISRDGDMPETLRNETNRYQYNGKEMQVGTGLLDYGARMYMPEIGRWGVVDPMSEVSRRWSTYTYGYDNPMRFIDRDGRLAFDINLVGEEAQKAFAQLQSSIRDKSDKDKSGGCLPNCPQTVAKADATSRAQSITPQIGQPSIQLPQQDRPILYDTDLKFLHGTQFTEYEKAVQTGIDIGSMAQIAGVVKSARAWLSGSKSGYINLASAARTTHIIAGDATGGGHAWFGSVKSFVNGATGQKSMFPWTWSGEKIMHAISDVAVNNVWIQQTGRAGATMTNKGQPVRYLIEGWYEGTKIRVITTSQDIITAFPVK